MASADVTAHNIKASKLVADEVETKKLQAGRVDAGNLQATKVNTGELQFGLSGGAQQDLLELPLQSSFLVIVSGPDGSFVHATVLNTGGLVQVAGKQVNGLDLVPVGNRLRVLNTSPKTKQVLASWVRVG